MGQSPPIPLLVFAGVAALLIFALAAYRVRYMWLVVIGMFAASSIAFGFDDMDRPFRTWISPLQRARSEIFAGCGAALFALAMIHIGKLNFTRISNQSIFVFLIGCYAGMVRVITGDAGKGLESIVFAAVTALPLIIALPMLLDDDGGYLRLIRGIGLVTAGWALAVAIQFTIDRSQLMRGGLLRFQGLLSNPQHAAAYLAPATVTTAWLYFSDPKLRYRLFWGVVAGAAAVMLMWTGSRSGVATAVIGGAAVAYARLGKVILLAPLAVLVAMAGLSVLEASNVDLGLDRLTSTADTRTGEWQGMLEIFLDNPIFGTGATEETAFSENSYLFGMASYGFGMGILLISLTLLSMLQCLKLLMIRGRLSPLGRSLADLTIGVQAMYFAGGMFEGYMIARVATSLMYIVIFGGIAAWLIDVANKETGQHAAEDEGDVDADVGMDDDGERAPAAA